MAQRTICIQSPAKLATKNRMLSVEGTFGKAAIPFEDIWVIILESHQAQITTAALSDLVDAGIGVMLCGDNHMPNGLLLPLGAHSRHAAIVEDQLAISKPLKKRLWQRIVMAKIANQAKVLDLMGKANGPLLEYRKQTTSGDTTNREAVAATYYFKNLLPVGGRRFGPYEAILDYGYTVLRAGIGREAVSKGWLVSRGIHHSNNLNAFNLVDDLIEPFRPVIDLLVLAEDFQDGLTPSNKAKLASVFEYKVLTGSEKVTVQTAITREFETLRDAVTSSDAMKLELPKVIPLERESHE